MSNLPKGKWDAKFHAFQKLTELAEILLPNHRNFTVEQCDALHEYSKILAKDLTDGTYVYTERKHIDTSDIPEVKDWSNAEVGKFYRGKEAKNADGSGRIRPRKS